MQDTLARVKEVWLEVAGEGAAEGPYALQPTTTARELLAAAGFQGWWLYAPDGGSFAYEDVLFDHVTDRQKLLVANAGPREVREADALEAADAPELVADAVWRQRRQE